MNKKNIVILSISLLTVFNFSCKDKTPKPVVTPPPPVVVAPDPVKKIFGVEIYNQALDTTLSSTAKKFYNITNQMYSNSVNFPIELAYVYNQPTNNSTRHVLGSAKSDIVKSRHSIPSTNNTSIEFYSIANFNNPALYDTITLSKSIGTIFDKKASLSTYEGESHAIASDSFGWDKDHIIGFKLANGKRGLIKLKVAPTGSKDNNEIVSVGKMLFDIKMEL